MSISLFLANATGAITTGLNAACQNGGSCNTNASLPTILGQIANVLIFLIGAISVIYVIIGGLRYVTSNGDSKQTTAAKDTILYAVIGVVVAIASFAIVSFVTSHFG